MNVSMYGCKKNVKVISKIVVDDACSTFTVIDDLEAIKFVVDKCGFRWKLEPKKTTSSDEDSSLIEDVFKRLPRTSAT